MVADMAQRWLSNEVASMTTVNRAGTFRYRMFSTTVSLALNQILQNVFILLLLPCQVGMPGWGSVPSSSIFSCLEHFLPPNFPLCQMLYV